MGEALLPVIGGVSGSCGSIGYNSNNIFGGSPTSIFEQTSITLDMSKTYVVMVILSLNANYSSTSSDIHAAIYTPVIYELAGGTLSPKLVVSGTSYTAASVEPSIDTATGVLSFPSTIVSNGCWFCSVAELI